MDVNAASRGRIDRHVDVSDLRMGDRMALAWLAQRERRATGVRTAVVDRGTAGGQRVDLPRYFPATFVGASAAGGLPRWEVGNLWLTAANAYAACRQPGCFEALPAPVHAHLTAIRAAPRPQPRVLVHVLDDAGYNFRRNWSRLDADRLVERLVATGCEVVMLNPAPGRFIGDFDRMLAEMMAADLFIGGDTGPSHVFAILRGGTPQIALYPDMAKDRASYAAEQVRLGLPLAWCSLPFQPKVDVVQLRKTKRIVRDGRGWRLQSVGRFDPAQIAALALTRVEA